MSDAALTTVDAVQQAAADIDSDSPLLDAELLMQHATGWSRTSQRAWPERPLAEAQAVRFWQLVRQRATGQPVAHLLGEQGFWSLPLQVNAATLIPRPDTECLVETALGLAVPDQTRVLDLGTGTGAIALALASERPDWQVSACDLMPAAVALARANAERLGLPVTVVQSHWFAGLPAQSFELIVSNPPYIAADDPHLTNGDLRFEPATALVSGADGLTDLRHIVAEAPAWLVAGGVLLVEHGHDQGTAVRALFNQAGFQAIETRKDYGGNERLTLGCKAPGAGV
ncbi:peptide chain release factor N(5)-glutamine methyltransferase [Marinobacter sp. X15-166B]|uniref:peptide chain release factor N(5)-glutamine methyltransferase n=1 Tax=Marinobacter sp. X15-166B TaxID=1897620 RepID=UPI00085C402B|nr:peptide chain release factor N(5)-glutamine methyltransferase [Marinobacter sp. X15-166B]OEY66852.1 protein-(glutamine-N5) methyltransferase, release factor-specific [Marinobacter sp. X15-166B]